jgi:hypothetical protein
MGGYRRGHFARSQPKSRSLHWTTWKLASRFCFLLATDRDAPLASRTYADFRSAFSLEGLLFGGVVGVLAYLLALIIMKALALVWQRASAVSA